LIRNRWFIPAALAVMLAACAAPPPPVVVPQGDARYIVDPRTGWTAATAPAVDRGFETAWRYVQAGDFTAARERLDAIRAKNGDYAPAVLANAAIAIREKRLDDAMTIIDDLLHRHPDYTAAQIYAAEIDVAENRLRAAYDRYRSIAAKPNAPPIAAERATELQTRVFDQLYGAALSASDTEAVRLLRDALTINPAATAARILLAQKLVAQRNFDEARRELDPVLSSGDADRAEVQEALAEIDIGKGRYQQAINRYERLTRRDTDGRFARRLAEIKDQFAEANMPPQYTRALEAESITRADLAVLMYWKVTAIRFAQDVPAPPIAIDISDVTGRDELIRAIALGIFPVDPITRRVNPLAAVTAGALSRIGSRILALRGAPCGKTLAACGIDDPAAMGEDVSVSGRAAAAMLDRIDKSLK
jgi:tetratricopeptide (TPR) repeat protein